MITLIVLGIAVTVVVVLFAAVLARNPLRRENRFAASGELGAMPWIAGGGSSECDAGTSSDAGCGDGGGGGGGD